MVHLSAEGLREFMHEHPGAVVLDVRSPREHHEADLRGDHHVPWLTADWTPDTGFLKAVLRRLRRDDYVVVICGSGTLSCEAAALLEEAGFMRVYTVLGGFGDIRQARPGCKSRGVAVAYRNRPGGPDHEQDPGTRQEHPATLGPALTRTCVDPAGRAARGGKRN